jgi:putative MATE family efflux protein
MRRESASARPLAVSALDEAHLGRSVLRLAWPVMVQQTSYSMVQLLDTFLVGHLGEDALAGLRLGAQIFWFAFAGMTAVGVGAIAVVSRSVGAQQWARARRAVGSALALALVWGLLVGVSMWALGGWALGMLGAEPEARRLGGQYLQAAAFGMPFWSLLYAANAVLQGAGDTRTPMAVGVFINVVNMLMAYSLINGVGPFPWLGVAGSGAGFTIAAFLGAVVILWLLASGRLLLRWSPLSWPLFHRSEAARVVQVGLPTALEQAQFNMAFMLYTRIVASLGTTAVAAHGVALAVQSLAFNAGMGISVATSALAGQGLGAGRPDLSERAVYAAARYASLVMGSVGLVLMVLGHPIVSLFVGGEGAEEVVDIGSRLMFIFGFAMPVLGANLAFSGGLRGAGDTRAVMLIMAFGTWVVRLGPAYLLAITAGLGAPGAWAAAVMDISARTFLMWWRFRSGRWKQIRV